MDATRITIGTPSRTREVAAIAVLAAGALVVAGMTLAGAPGYQTLLGLGVTATIAWLVDGTSRRYVGPALLGLATGGGITASQAAGLDTYEHPVVYPAIGVAILALTFLNADTIRPAGAFLVYTGLAAIVGNFIVSYDVGWAMVGILAAWAAFEAVRIGRSRPADGGRLAPAVPRGTPAATGRARGEAELVRG